MRQEKTAVDKEWPLQPKFCNFIELQKKKKKLHYFIIYKQDSTHDQLLVPRSTAGSPTRNWSSIAGNESQPCAEKMRAKEVLTHTPLRSRWHGASVFSPLFPHIHTPSTPLLNSYLRYFQLGRCVFQYLYFRPMPFQAPGGQVPSGHHFVFKLQPTEGSPQLMLRDQLAHNTNLCKH